MSDVPHPIHRRLLAEDLLRRRRSDEGRRFAASQRQGRIDPNPHQIDAVVFALHRIPEGGCILADEVGLGKTIEAGLIIAQLLVEGKRRILLIVPKVLLGQWKAELYDLFGIDARETSADPDAFRGDGVFLVHRELAGGEKGAPLLWHSDAFDLVVIDEAHEVFAGIYKRYSRDGSYNEHSKEAHTAHRVRELVRRHAAPVLLLTATPIQNTLTELWGLVQYVDPTGTLLGRITTFRELFCDQSDQKIAQPQAGELRRRLARVVQRTLRRQAQEFLDVPFVARQARLIQYAMSAEEKALYEDVSAWLLRPDLIAFAGLNGRLLLVGFLRRMASSLPALAASLRQVAARIRRTLGRGGNGEPQQADALEFAEDLEDEIEGPSVGLDAPQSTGWRERLSRELAEVEGFIARTEAIRDDSKARALLGAVRIIRERAARGDGTGKVVIFTESLTTQDHLRDLLIGDGISDGAITLFRGQNISPRAREALERWTEEIGRGLPPDQRPSRDVAMRLALVHEFRERSDVFISTEAGAKGLNLQFCETLVNYDLPWNPQRIEQRIGRVHRYGQKFPVTIINFLARDNEAQRLTFEILSQKLELFGTVLDASDAVLHAAHGHAEPLVSAVGYDLEVELRRIYDQSRSMEEVAVQLRMLHDRLDERRRGFDQEQARTAHLIETRLDDAVGRVFRRYKEQLAAELDEFDRDLDRLVAGFLDAVGATYQRTAEPHEVRFDISPSDRLPVAYRHGRRIRTGSPRDEPDIETLHLAHPLVRAALEEARASTARPAPIRWQAPPGGWSPALGPFAGTRGRLVLVKVSYEGFEAVDRILAVAIAEGRPDALSPEILEQLLALPAVECEERADLHAIEPHLLEDAIEARVFADQSEIDRKEEHEFQHRLGQLERYLDDQILVRERRRVLLLERLEKLERQYESELTSVGRDNKTHELRTVRSELQKVDVLIAKLAARDDEEFRSWLDRLYTRRYEPPRVERLVEVDFVIGEEETRC